MEDFAQHVALSRSNMEELFVKEYADLEVDQTFTQHNAKLAINRTKNRYINITPCKNYVIPHDSRCYYILLDDHSRVPLKMDYQTTGSDYINASFVDVSKLCLAITRSISVDYKSVD